MKHFLLIFICSLIGFTIVKADDFYWKGGNGYWSDLKNWEVRYNGGFLPAENIPSVNDNVYFVNNTNTDFYVNVLLDVRINNLHVNGNNKVIIYEKNEFNFKLNAIADPNEQLISIGSFLINNDGSFTQIKSKYHGNAGLRSGISNNNVLDHTSISITTTRESCRLSCDGNIIIKLNTTCPTYNVAYINSQGVVATVNNITSNVADTLKNLCNDGEVYSIAVTDCDTTIVYETVNSGSEIQVSGPAPFVWTINPLNPVVSCSGVCDGSTNLTVTGGNPPRTLSWSDGGTGLNRNNLCAGNVTITVSDQKGCTADTVITVSNPTPITGSLISSNVTCSGNCDANASVNPTGGTAPYVVTWYNSSGTAIQTDNVISGGSSTLSSLCVGNYAVKIVDSKSCKDSSTFSVTIPNPIVINSIPTDASCFGACDGEFAVTISGGTAPYAVSSVPALAFSVVGSNADVTGVCANEYVITVTDNNGCEQDLNDTIYEPAQIIITPTGTPDEYCVGSSSTLSAVSSVNGVTFSWSGGITTPTTGTPVTTSVTTTTTFTVTGTNPLNGCTADTTITITVNPLPVITTTPTAPPVCLGGSVNLTASGALTYSWTPSTGLSATTGASVDADPTSTETYTVFGTDVNGCVGDTTVTVTVNPPPSISVSPASAVSCALAPVDFTASGMTGGTYNWTSGSGSISGSPGTNVTVTPIANTIVTVIATDINGCKDTATATLTVQPLPNITAVAAASPICEGASTMLTGNGAGALGSYSWVTGVTTIGTSNPQSVSPILSTTYTVYGTDVNNCTNSANVSVNVNPKPDVQVTLQTPVCQGTASSATAINANTYTWYDNLGNIISSTNNVTITPSTSTTITVVGYDAIGCADTVVSSIAVNMNPTISGTATPALICEGSTSTLTGSGAGAGGTYSWINGASTIVDPNPITVSPTSTTTYTLIGEDANGCVNDTTVTVTVNPPINFSPNNPTICSGTSATITATGAVTYTWFNMSGTQIDTGATITVTPPSTTSYVVEGTDINGCIGSDTITVTVNPFLPLTVPNDTSICLGSSLVLTASSSGIGVNYTWTGTSMTPASGIGASITVNPVPAGTYTYNVVASDTNNCTSSDQVLVTVNGLPTVTAPASQSVCIGSSVNLTASGAVNYSWFILPSGNNIGTGTPLSVSPNSSTSYSVIGIDGNGCSSSAFTSIIVHNLPNAFAGNDAAICFGGNTTLTANGGITFSWDPPTGLSNIAISNPTASPTVTTNYSVFVTDANGCKDVDTLTVTVNTINVVANANNGLICFGSNTVLLSSPAGGQSYVWTANTAPTGLSNPNIQNPTATPTTTTIYSVHVTDVNGCIGTDTALVTVDRVQATRTITSPSGCGINDGAVNLTVTNGVGPYTYSWSNGQVTEDISNLAAGNYTVTITDSKGCTGTLVANVSNTSAISLDGSIVQDVTTCGGADGSVTLNITGASGSETYSWSNGATTPNISGLTAGDYDLTITDAPCVVTRTFTVNDPTPVNPFAGNDTTVCAGSSITLNASLNGGVNPVWTPGGAGSSINVIINNPTTYVITVLDTNNCTATDDITVSINALPVVSAGSDLNVCNGSDANLTASGALNYSWSGTGTLSASNIANPVALNVSDTVVFYVQGTDLNGCVNSDTVELFVNPITTSGVVTDATICGVADGSIDVTVSGGFPTINYQWDYNGEVTEDLSGLDLGVYTLIVTDGAGCSDTSAFAVSEPATFTLAETHIDASSCTGVNNGSIDITITGGTNPFTYAWTGPLGYTASTDDISSLAVGQYDLIVQDSTGCGAAISVNIASPVPVDVFAGSDLTICLGDSITISSTPVASGTYSWTGASIISGASTEDLVVNPSATSQYTVFLTDVNGCLSQDEVTVFVNNVAPSMAISNVSTCGGSDGSIVVTVSGGSLPYSYSWNPSSPGSGGFNNTGLVVGPYEVFITDVIGCTGSVSGNVNDPSNINFTGSVVNSPTTCGGNDGSISVSVGGGTTPYTYSWTTGGLIGSNPINLSPGSYTLIVTDSVNCSATNTFTVNDPSPVGVANAGPDVTICSGSQIFFTADTSNINTYSWASSSSIVSGSTSNSPTVTGTVTSNYTLFTVDNISCRDTDVVILNVNNNPTVSVISSSANLCAGGTVTLTANGANSYTWSPATGLSAAINNIVDATVSSVTTYNVTGIDSIGCSSSASITITPTQIFSLTKSIISPTSCTSNDGSINITVSGGSGNFNYNWLPGNETTQDLSNLGGGVYLLTVTDAISGCTDTISASITEPSTLVVTGVIFDATSCADSGLVDLTISGGTAPINIAWTNGSVSEDIEDISGTYGVVVTDANGCSFAQTYFINEPTPLQVNAGVDQNICPGTTTSLSATGSVNYSWVSSGTLFPDNTSASPIINPTSTTNYYVVATDQNNCLSYDTVTVFVNTMFLAVAKTDISTCGGIDGAINLTVNGGNDPYTYLWSNGSTQEDLVGNLPLGSYQCIVTDSIGCTDTISTTVAEPSGFSFTSVNTNPSSCSGSSGSIVLNIPVGVQVQSTFVNGVLNGTLTNLVQGFYNIVVTDTNGCSSSLGVTLTDPIPSQIYAGADTFVCAGNSVQLTAITAGINTYSWVGNGLSCTSCSNPTITPTVTEVLTVFGTDNNGCITSDVVSVSPNALSVNAVATNSTQCNLDNGTLVAQVTGGTGAITYTWSGGPNINADNQNNVPPGIYTIVINDVLSGCSATDNATIQDPVTYAVSLNSIDPSTCNGTDGSITAISNPVGSYTYTWNGASDDSIHSGLTLGVYTLTVNDAVGCTFVIADTLTDPTPAVPNAGANISVCFGSGLVFNVTGGTFASAQWSPATYLDNPNVLNPTATPLAATTYTLNTIDNRNCSSSDTVTISVSHISFNDSVYQSLSCGSATGAIKVNVTGGTAPFTHHWNNGATADSIGGLTAGVYIDSITDALGCVDTAMFIINDPVVFTTSIVSNNPTVCDASNGSIQLTINNQTDPVTYLLNGVNVGNPPFNNLAEGIYTVSVTDATGCTKIEAATLTDPAAVQVDYVNSLTTCSGNMVSTVLNNASQISSAIWQPVVTDLSCINCLTPQITPLNNSVYTVTAIDINGCVSYDTVTVTASVLNTASSVVPPSCSQSDGQILLTLNGITPYTISWSTGASGLNLTGIGAGFYQAFIRDSIGCKDTVTVLLSDSVNYTVTSTVVNPVNCGGSNGSISLAITGGISPFTFNWLPGGQTTQTLINASEGVYVVTIKDSINCSLVYSDTLSDPQPTQVNAGVGGSVCLGNSFNLSAQTGFISYSWSPSLDMLPASTVSNPTVSPLAPTIYTLTAVDINNCKSTDTVFVGVSTFDINAIASDVSICGGTDGSVAVTVIGGVSPINYTWSGGQTTEDISGLDAGIYTLEVSDASGCVDSVTVDVDDPIPFTYVETLTPITTCGGLGSINEVVTGGTSPIIFVLNNDTISMPVNNLAEGNYALLIIDASGCTEAINFNLAEPDSSIAFAGPDQTACMGAPGIQLNASANIGGGNYSWSPAVGLSSSTTANPVVNLDTTITYYLTFTDNNNCVSRDTVTINSVKINLTDTLITPASDCFSSNGAIDITVGGGVLPYTYSWSIDSVTQDVSGLPPSTISVTISESSSFSCVRIFNLEVPSQIPIITVAGSDTPYCTGDTVKLDAVGATNYTWSELGGAVLGTTNPIIVNPTVGTTTYIVIGTTGVCFDQDTITVILYQSPTADAGSDIEMLEGNPELIGGTPITTSPITYSWYPNQDLSDISVANPSVNPKETTVYYLTITDTLGCKGTDSVLVTVFPSIIVPGGFTPNADGANDKWIIDFIYKYPAAIVQVYNRWGQMLYESAPGYPDPWDGKYNGSDLPVGTYYYIIDVKDADVKPYTGPITIMR